MGKQRQNQQNAGHEVAHQSFAVQRLCGLLWGEWHKARKIFLKFPLLTGGATLALAATCTIHAKAALAAAQQAPAAELPVHLSWGYSSPPHTRFYVKLLPTSGVMLLKARGVWLEAGEGLKDGAWQTEAGGGDIDGVDFIIAYPPAPPERRQDIERLWAYLIDQSAADTARRLSEDAAFWINPPRFTLQMNAEGTKGFTVAVKQLLAHPALWVPSLDVYLTASPHPMAFKDNQTRLRPWQGRRILQQVASEPEATYQEFAARWADTGNPDYEHPRLPQPGHIVCLSWDSAIPKFGIDRRAGVWNDYGNPDHFRFWYSFGSIGEGLRQLWKNQSLANGLPVITTTFEKRGVRYDVEQFAYPLHGPPSQIQGDLPMVLLQRITATNQEDQPRAVSISMDHERMLPPYSEKCIVAAVENGATVFEDRGRHKVLFSIQGVKQPIEWGGVSTRQRDTVRVEATVFLNLKPHASRQFVVKLPSPVVGPADLNTLLGIDYDSARTATLNFWSAYVARGAQFQVPEKVVNEIFRASLWHARMLPRRHGGPGENIQIDLPYSNFAYQQTGTPWPVNQAVYVDYMLYGLRGYPKLATEELRVIYRNNQEFDGRVDGNANWGAYTPGMLYAVGKNYLLSGNRAELNELLPHSLKALDWCLRQLRKAGSARAAAPGLFEAPLNDGTGDGAWAFNQAYMYAGLETFGEALHAIGNPRGDAALAAASELKAAIARAFGHASMLSPLVELRDHTWTPYVPSDAFTPRRLLEQWYPTDVDTGAVHLLRLGALPASGRVADNLLNDQEDNLYYKGWGMTDEPVYAPQATAYLLRDDPKAVIRDFYSMMASAFSHTVFEPLEHRWGHQEYFGPPSTDGSWFNIYRHMLINELGEGTLILAEATPRSWLENGSTIKVQRAPTRYGSLSFVIQSEAAAGRITADILMPERSYPKLLLVRLRHPQKKPLRSVTVNGQNWTGFDPAKEWIRVQNPEQKRYMIVARY
jgi:hypothetical protein